MLLHTESREYISRITCSNEMNNSVDTYLRKKVLWGRMWFRWILMPYDGSALFSLPPVKFAMKCYTNKNNRASYGANLMLLMI